MFVGSPTREDCNLSGSRSAGDLPPLEIERMYHSLNVTIKNPHSVLDWKKISVLLWVK